jgi:prepilin-type N-terminal cleavage/methylation domain-containing protein
MKQLLEIRHESRKKGGFSLIELVIAMAVLSVFLLGASSYFRYNQLDQSRDRSIASRDSVLFGIANSALMAPSLRNSYLHGQSDSTLAKCLQPQLYILGGKLPANPYDCTPGSGPSPSPIPLVLYEAMYKYAGASALTSTALAGSAPNGPAPDPSSTVIPSYPSTVYYDANGFPCLPSTKTYCPIQAWATFTAQCPPATPLGPPAPACDVAELIQVQLHLDPYTKGVGSTPLAGQPAMTFASVVENFSVPVQEIAGSTPAVNPSPIVIPSVGPSASPSPGGNGVPGGVGGGGAGNPPPAIPPIACPGDTIQIGPYSCVCPPMETLINPITGKCKLFGSG